jgi:hypothetical protein
MNIINIIRDSIHEPIVDIDETVSISVDDLVTKVVTNPVIMTIPTIRYHIRDELDD